MSLPGGGIVAEGQINAAIVAAGHTRPMIIVSSRMV